MATTIRQIRKVELHQHLDGSIPPRTIWRLMKGHGLTPVPTLRDMRRLLQLQEDEEGSLLAYLDKFHYPLWITQFYENSFIRRAPFLVGRGHRPASRAGDTE